MRSGRVWSRRDSCSTLLMMVLTRSPLLVMMSVRRRSCVDSAVDSASSCAAWLIAPTGLRISCAMLALSRPRAASFDCCTRSTISVVSSRNTSVGPLPLLSSETKCGWIRLPPSEASIVSVLSCQSSARRRHVSSRYSRRGETSPSGVPCWMVAPCSSSAADSLIRRIVSFASTTRMLSRRCCTMNWFSSARLATSTSR